MASASQNYLAIIKIAGVGGGGVSAVNRMIEVGLRSVEFIAANTGAQVLLISDTDVKLDVSRELTYGLGARADPSKGRQAAEDHSEDIEEALKGAGMVFVTAGEGDGTSMGAAPIVAKIVRSLSALATGAVTRPFSFKGRCRATQADPSVEALREEVDTLIVIPNDRLLRMTNHQVVTLDVFKQTNRILMQGASGIMGLITTPGLINPNLADVKSIMSQAGSALMGIGSIWGENWAHAAAETAISSPLLETSIDGAHRVLLSITGGLDLGLFKVSAVTQLIEETVHDEANIIFGTVIDDTLGDEVRIVVIAAGFDGRHPPRPSRLETARSNRQQPPQPCGGFGGVPGGGLNPLAGGTPLTSGGDSRLAPPYVTPIPPTRPEPRPLRVDDDDDLDVPDFTKWRCTDGRCTWSRAPCL